VPASLRSVPLDGLRALSQSDASGRFRPNKASPNLVGGWIHFAADASALDAALEALLPGGLEDWYSRGNSTPIGKPGCIAMWRL
jgi:hypothetical protein